MCDFLSFSYFSLKANYRKEKEIIEKHETLNYKATDVSVYGLTK